MNTDKKEIGELISQKENGKMLYLKFKTVDGIVSPSCFVSDLKEGLVTGERYAFTTYHREYEGKDYLNIKARWKGRDKVGLEIAIVPDEGNAKPISSPDGQSKPKDANAARERYWERKEQNELERQGVITMLNCISSACNLFRIDEGGKMPPASAVIAYAQVFYDAAEAKKRKENVEAVV